MARSATEPDKKKRRAAFLKQVYLWHWVSSGLCLIGMLLFAITGITLNHAGQIEASPKVVTREAKLPDNLLAELKGQPAKSKAALSDELSAWIKRETGASTASRAVEWSAKEAYVSLPKPGGDAWLAIDRDSGDITYETTDRGWIAYLNDLHKGRHTGSAWSWFIDLFAVATILFCLTGVLLLQLHAARRPATWPVVGLGFVLPVVLIILFIH